MLFEDKFELRLGRMTPANQFASIPAFGLQVNGGINGNPNSLFVRRFPRLATRMLLAS